MIDSFQKKKQMYHFNIAYQFTTSSLFNGQTLSLTQKTIYNRKGMKQMAELELLDYF